MISLAVATAAVLVAAVGGFIAGALVYRNNAKRAEADLQTSQAEVARLKALIPK